MMKLNPPWFYKEQSKPTFYANEVVVSKLRTESLLLNLIDVEVKMVEIVFDLCQPSMFTTTLTTKSFLPSWAIYRCVIANMKVMKTQS